MAIAPTMPSEPVEPLAFSAMVEMSSVAMAMPETGLFDDPISPTMREETGREEEAEYQHDQRAEEAHRDGREQPHEHRDQQAHGEHDLHGDVLLGAQSTGGALP